MDLSIDRPYHTIKPTMWEIQYGQHVKTSKFDGRKIKGKITPNFDATEGYRQQSPNSIYKTVEVRYSLYKTMMLARVKQCMESQYKGMIVNRGGHPKTNTTETCYRYLRRMIKDGILKMEKRSAYGRKILSVLVIVK